MGRNSYDRGNRNYSNSYDDDLLTSEQKHRHELQDRYFKSSVRSFRIGQFFGFAYNVILIYFIYDMAKFGDESLALKIFFLNVVLIGFIAVLSKSRGRKRRSSNRRSSNREGNGMRVSIKRKRR